MLNEMTLRSETIQQSLLVSPRTQNNEAISGERPTGRFFYDTTAKFRVIYTHSSEIRGLCFIKLPRNLNFFY